MNRPLTPRELADLTHDWEAAGLPAPQDDDAPSGALLWTVTACAIFTVTFLAWLGMHFR